MMFFVAIYYVNEDVELIKVTDKLNNRNEV